MNDQTNTTATLWCALSETDPCMGARKEHCGECRCAGSQCSQRRMEMPGDPSVRAETSDRVQTANRSKPDYGVGAYGSTLGFLTDGSHLSTDWDCVSGPWSLSFSIKLWSKAGLFQ